MSSRNWCFYSAVIGGVIALCLGIVSAHLVAFAQLPVGKGGAEKQERSEGQKQQAQPAPSPPQPLAQNKVAQHYQPDCTRPSNREDGYYCEIRRLADSVKISAAAADEINWSGWFQVGAGVAAAIATALAAIYAGIAANAAGMSADIAKQALTVTQRAYVSVEPLGIRERKGADAWVGHVGIRNAGLLPARDVRWKISIERFGTDKDWEGFLYVHPYRGNHVIPTGTTMRRGSEPFSVGTIGDLQELWMYVWGEVTYTDGFGKERFTKFCHRYNNQAIVPDGKGRHWIPPEDARYHDHGNEAS